jgi:uncharacterized protein
MKAGQATGLQIAFLMFAVMLIAVPLTHLVIAHASLEGIPAEIVAKGMHFALAIVLIVSVTPLRRFAARELRAPIRPPGNYETALVAAANVALIFAAVGALSAWLWVTHGPERVARLTVDVDSDMAKAFSPTGLVRIVISIFVAPIVEEIVFRGFVYRAFERHWGWFASMLATSLLFAVYHPFAWSAFAFSVVCVCILRRTGSLRAPIVVHTTFNLFLWWPLLGRHVFPTEGDLAEPATWTLQFAGLAFVLVALPVYVWMSRDRCVVSRTMFLEPNGALSK